MQVGLCLLERDALNGPVRGEMEALCFTFWAKVELSKHHSSAETVFYIKPYQASSE